MFIVMCIVVVIIVGGLGALLLGDGLGVRGALAGGILHHLLVVVLGYSLFFA